MKFNKIIIVTFFLLIITAALYRLIPNRPPGFAPQLAMAIFAGAIIKDRKWAFALPILSMFLSDVLYQIFYNLGWSSIPGFYVGQFTNYILFALMTVVGFLIRRVRVWNIAIASLVAPTIYFFLSNFMVWWNGAGLQRSKDLKGLVQSLSDGLPFYRNSLLATFIFSGILFGGFFLLKNYLMKPRLAN